MGLWIIVIFILILLPLMIVFFIPKIIRHYKSTGAILNYNSTMTKFVYKVPMPKDDIIRMLQMKNAAERLTCTVDLENLIVTFQDVNSTREYYFYIEKYNSFSILKLAQTTRINTGGHILYELNPYIISKLQAEPILFSEYGF